jgi:hypothetical protein
VTVPAYLQAVAVALDLDARRTKPVAMGMPLYYRQR